MNIARSRLSACVLMAPGWDLVECVEEWQRAGLAGIGLSMSTVYATGIDRAVDVLRASGLRVASLMGLDPFEVVHPERFKAGLPEVMKELDFAAALGSDCVYAVCGPRADVPWDVAADRATSQMEALIPLLSDRGLRLAIEPVHPLRQDLSFVNLATDVEKLLDRVPSPSIGYVFDFWHLWWTRDAADVARRTACRVFSAQPSDHKKVTLRSMDRAIPGQGIAPIAQLVEALEEGGYRGFYDLEVLSSDNEDRGYRRTLQEAIEGFGNAVGGLRS